jgi:phosphoenolpyruvate carboxylase
MIQRGRHRGGCESARCAPPRYIIYSPVVEGVCRGPAGCLTRRRGAVLPARYGVGRTPCSFSDTALLQEVLEACATGWQLENVVVEIGNAHSGALRGLVQDQTLGAKIVGRIRDAWSGARDADGYVDAAKHPEMSSQARLLRSHAMLDASIRLRLPDIEPLNTCHVEMLKQHRVRETDSRVRAGIRPSINATAPAGRNSG